jgi:hypothetical protein
VVGELVIKAAVRVEVSAEQILLLFCCQEPKILELYLTTSQIEKKNHRIATAPA